MNSLLGVIRPTCLYAWRVPLPFIQHQQHQQHQQQQQGQQRRQFSACSYQAKTLDLDAMMKRLPPKPEPPDNDDCCLSGCEFCVWDLYDSDMREYQEQAKAIRQAFEARGKPVPEQLRPENIQDSVDPTMRAFLDMERDLAIKAQEERDKEKLDREGDYNE
ncbi:hypothetical protein GGI12_001337 [Dipsacomyces acuminosporus]|nr:hypothetical protein GGI12_001337 [Dipsacomyces acuminosporus]